MGYMDVPAQGQANGHSVVLMHGKNFAPPPGKPPSTP